MSLAVAAFYQFTPLAALTCLQTQLSESARHLGLKGTCILAPEGFNATLSGEDSALKSYIQYFKEHLQLASLDIKWSKAERSPFKKLKFLIKAEIITLNYPLDEAAVTAPHISPSAWNELLNEPDLILIDTRNFYEVALGSFPGALNPQTENFGSFPDFVAHTLKDAKHQKIAMFCTGGIRCEKASNHLIQQGFEQVYQLQGGILNYLEHVPENDSRWQGECFVFDERISLKVGLATGEAELCFACRLPLLPEDKLKAGYEANVSCHHCVGSRTPAQLAQTSARLEHLLAARQFETL